jgi:hypothetical protein
VARLFTTPNTTARKVYFPQPGDDAKRIEYKRQLRDDAIMRMKQQVGPGYRPPPIAAVRQVGAARAAAQQHGPSGAVMTRAIGTVAHWHRIRGQAIFRQLLPGRYCQGPPATTWPATTGEAVGHGIMQGASFGLRDEGQGLIEAGGGGGRKQIQPGCADQPRLPGARRLPQADRRSRGRGQIYQAATERERGYTKQIEQEHPGAYLGGNVLVRWRCRSALRRGRRHLLLGWPPAPDRRGGWALPGSARARASAAVEGRGDRRSAGRRDRWRGHAAD